MVHHYDVPKPGPKPPIAATQVLTQNDLDALEARRVELDEQIADVKRSLHGPIPDGASWGEDYAGPWLLLPAGPLEWGESGAFLSPELDGFDGISLECLELFCQRTRAWREARKRCNGNHAQGNCPKAVCIRRETIVEPSKSWA